MATTEEQTGLTVRTISPNITTLTVQFTRFAPFGFRKFIAVGNRATAIKLSSGQILLLNPIPLNATVKGSLDALGGVHFLACDLGHHLSIQSYLDTWPEAKSIGVKGLETKRSDVKWDYIYDIRDGNKRPECVFGWEDEIESICFDGFITRAVAWLHKPSRTLIVSDLVMNLPAIEGYTPQYLSSAGYGPGSWAFAQVAKPYTLFFRMLIYIVATTDYVQMKRDAKSVAGWELERMIVCHGQVIEERGKEAWSEAYSWFLMGGPRAGFVRGAWDAWMSIMRRAGLGAW